MNIKHPSYIQYSRDNMPVVQPLFDVLTLYVSQRGLRKVSIISHLTVTPISRISILGIQHHLLTRAEKTNNDDDNNSIPSVPFHQRSRSPPGGVTVNRLARLLSLVRHTGDKIQMSDTQCHENVSVRIPSFARFICLVGFPFPPSTVRRRSALLLVSLIPLARSFAPRPITKALMLCRQRQRPPLQQL